MSGRSVSLAFAALVAGSCAPATQVGTPAPDDALVADLRYLSSAALDGVPSAVLSDFLPSRDVLAEAGFGVRDAGTRHLSHLGADDNASGTAALVELARRLAAAPTRRSVAFVHFGSEELGLFGSRTFVRRPPFPLDSAVAMVNIDTWSAG